MLAKGGATIDRLRGRGQAARKSPEHLMPHNRPRRPLCLSVIVGLAITPC